MAQQGTPRDLVERVAKFVLAGHDNCPINALITITGEPLKWDKDDMGAYCTMQYASNRLYKCSLELVSTENLRPVFELAWKLARSEREPI